MDARPVAGTWVRLIGALAYATLILAVGMWMFQSRELGGSEG